MEQQKDIRNEDVYIKDGRSDILYTVREVALLLKTNVDYIHRLRKSGLLPFLKIGQYKVRKVALDNFLAKYEGKDITDPFEVKEL